MPPPDPQLLFGQCVHDLASEPTLENALRYLAASRFLEIKAEPRPADRKQE
jgi:hypothetical protein